MLAQRQEKRDYRSRPKDWVKNWMFKRKKSGSSLFRMGN
jgi:hypothetical protein